MVNAQSYVGQCGNGVSAAPDRSAVTRAAIGVFDRPGTRLAAQRHRRRFATCHPIRNSGGPSGRNRSGALQGLRLCVRRRSARQTRTMPVMQGIPTLRAAAAARARFDGGLILGTWRRAIDLFETTVRRRFAQGTNTNRPGWSYAPAAASGWCRPVSVADRPTDATTWISPASAGEYR